MTWELLSSKPSYIPGSIGSCPTWSTPSILVVVTLLSRCPLGVGAAVYLTEYAQNRRLVSAIEFATETLTGIPLYHLRTGGYAPLFCNSPLWA